MGRIRPIGCDAQRRRRLRPHGLIRYATRYTQDMTCPNCKSTLPADSQFCSSCGARIAFKPPDLPSEPARFDSILAEANLHRMRPRWTDAEAKCIEVMRAAP